MLKILNDRLCRKKLLASRALPMFAALARPWPAVGKNWRSYNLPRRSVQRLCTWNTKVYRCKKKYTLLKVFTLISKYLEVLSSKYNVCSKEYQGPPRQDMAATVSCQVRVWERKCSLQNSRTLSLSQHAAIAKS